MPNTKSKQKRGRTPLPVLGDVARACREAEAAELPLLQLPEDLWLRIFELFVRDRCGNIVVTGLAQLARLSRTSRCLLWAARAIQTPYDADIEFASRDPAMGTPISFVGGVAFGEFRCCFALAIVRHAPNGRVFVVSTESHQGFEAHGAGLVAGSQTFGGDETHCVHVVKRKYSFCQLVHLLNGHSACWEKRLADFARLQHFSDGWTRREGRRLIKNCVDFVPAQYRPPAYIPPTGFVEPIKLKSSSTEQQHHDDCITHAVSECEFVVHNQHGVASLANFYKRNHTLILFEVEDGGSHHQCDPKKVGKYILPDRCWYGKHMRCSRGAHDNAFEPVKWPNGEEGFFFKRPTNTSVHATDLSVALGLYSDPDQAEVWGLVSLFKHYDGKYELLQEERNHGTRDSKRREQAMAELRPSLCAWHSRHTPRATLFRMAELANAAANHLASQPEAPRTQRGAAAKAMQGMHLCAQAESRTAIPPSAEAGDPDYDYRRQPDTDDEGEGGEEDGAYASDVSEVAAGKRHRRRRAAKGGERKRKRAPGLSSGCSVERFLALSEMIGR